MHKLKQTYNHITRKHPFLSIVLIPIGAAIGLAGALALTLQIMLGLSIFKWPGIIITGSGIAIAILGWIMTAIDLLTN